jgi:outer membrane protein assembly factor BamB
VSVTGASFNGARSGNDFATVAYNAATGAQLWVRRYNGPGSGADQATSVAVSPGSGTVFVGGPSLGTSGLDYAAIAYKG